MYKAFCAIVLLLGTLALTGGQSTAVPGATLTSPQVVAKGWFKDQTTTIPGTNMFIPKRNGIYRLSVYMTQTVPTQNGNSWNFLLNWTDDAGPEQANAYSLATNLTPPQAYGAVTSGIPGSVMVFQAWGDAVIYYSVVPTGQGDMGTYSLYYVLERVD